MKYHVSSLVMFLFVLVMMVIAVIPYIFYSNMALICEDAMYKVIAG